MPAALETQASAGEIVAFRGPAYIGGVWRQVESRELSCGYRLTVSGTQFLVGDSGVNVGSSESADPELRRAVVEGPGGFLCRALRRGFSLHASAVELAPGAAFAFVGSSGAGKSTLASLLAASGSRKVADDLLDLSPIGGVVRGAEEELARHETQEHRPLLRAVCSLGPASMEVELTRLTGSAAVTTLVRHTVAASLFGPRLLADHLSFCADLALAVRVYRLSYPRRMDIGARVAEVLRHV